jgi:lipopolysaccharide/colanic/teichoic acid biosynthesis glycosyltransferase
VIKNYSLTPAQSVLKRTFDLLLAIIGLAMTWWIILLAWLAASIDTRSNGFFTQQRVGKGGKLFTVIKIKTMRPMKNINTTVTRQNDPRITRVGSLLRRTKIDELPQLWNVLVGDMSFVGPRPDVEGFADRLEGEERAILSIRPGITGPATLKYHNEEGLLASVEYPEQYNMEVIWPDKVRINLEYIQHWSLRKDIEYIIKTVTH